MKKGYLVKELKMDEFKDLKYLSTKYIANRNKDLENKTVQWLKIKRLHFEKSIPNVVYFSYQSQGSYRELHVYEKTAGRPESICLNNFTPLSYV
ncbi:hypothetical protein PR048_007310 [Dryococelus australis]|uniref:Uncharacterized protein n=1 Tax=Dryococelus australis TaxID=614101 RepID=A0ABQ9IDE9_9NEOP|nr:hypothetical protein PR048_007310 [Dryococelus australis]